ncbi:MAG: ADP-glyceromanno-heptose 6-epimerase [Candidatus Omnitrophica bacterium]|nr:ADP-glyceromanno-heptose 6-epimerase [Candidatus Omnitrophota bacterium]
MATRIRTARTRPKILLTGGAGFIGSCLLWKLNALGFDDILVVDALDASEKWKNLLGKRFEDYLDRRQLLERIDQGALDDHVDTIIHLGACTSTTETDAAYLMENNYRYSRRLAEWALKRRKRFLYASSAATYGDGAHGYSDRDEETPRYRPLNMYGYSKHLFDLWVLKHALQRQFVGFKFFNVYGPNEHHKDDMRSVVHKGYGQVKATGKIRLFKSYHPKYKDGEQQRDFVYVKDAVDAIAFFLDRPALAGIYNLGTGKAQTWNDLANALFAALKRPPQIEYYEMPETLREKYQYFTQANIDKLRSAGYVEPFMNLRAGVADYVKILEAIQYL